MHVPPLTREQMRAFDRLAIEQLGIPSIVLMENAGVNVTHIILDTVEQEQQLIPSEAAAIVFCGGGNNGGDGFVIARHLHNHNVHVEIICIAPLDQLKGDAAVNAAICQNMQIPMLELPAGEMDDELLEACGKANILVDAILGTGFAGQVREDVATAIHGFNAVQGPMKVAVDVPSGFDMETAQPSNATVQADITVTFVGPKQAMEHPDARAYTGDVLVVDIGAPVTLLRNILAPIG